MIKAIIKFIRNFFKKDCCKAVLLLFSFSLAPKISFAQQDMPGMNMQKDTAGKSMDMQMSMDSMNMSMNMPVDSMNMKMTSSFSPNLSMNRDGSGTSWQPDANPMMM